MLTGPEPHAHRASTESVSPSSFSLQAGHNHQLPTSGWDSDSGLKGKSRRHLPHLRKVGQFLSRARERSRRIALACRSSHSLDRTSCRSSGL
jgi:hypothetical protein